MSQKFESVERHLYRRTYQTGDGNWSTLFYAIFTCWDRKRRTFAIGDNVTAARDKLGELRNLNRGRHDFENCENTQCPCGCGRKKLQRQPEPQRLTVSGYIPEFLKTKKGMPSYSFWNVCTGHLHRLIGTVALDEVTRSRIAEYKQIRKTEPIVRHGKPVQGTTVSASTANREITALIGLLNLAAENGLLEKVPATKKLKDAEGHLARERVLDADEYKALLDASPRWLQRCIIGAYEACLSRVDLLTLSVDEVHRKRPETALIKLTGGRDKTKAKQKVPISPALAEVLDELDRERRKLTSLHGASVVFTRDGKPISRNALRKAFDAAKKQAGVNDFHFHDFRHCAVTRWALAGIPEEVRKLAAGHSRGSVHQRYINPPDEQMVKIFAESLKWNFVDEVFTQELSKTADSAK
jgi:integrase